MIENVEKWGKIDKELFYPKCNDWAYYQSDRSLNLSMNTTIHKYY